MKLRVENAFERLFLLLVRILNRSALVPFEEAGEGCILSVSISCIQVHSFHSWDAVGTVREMKNVDIID